MTVFELPLFPLNTVLFPGMPLQLHIFEERYKSMINMCIKQNVPFGVVLIQRGVEAHGPLAEPHLVGCTAQIIEVQPLPEGRMNITAIGQDRFRTILLYRDKAPYLTGILEPFPLADENPDQARAECQKLRPWLKRYLELLSTMGGIDLELPEIPEEPAAMAFLAAITLQVPNIVKQQLLDTEQISAMLRKLHNTFRREISLLRSMEDTIPQGKIGGFSVN